jgi:hypothetical protein
MREGTRCYRSGACSLSVNQDALEVGRRLTMWMRFGRNVSAHSVGKDTIIQTASDLVCEFNITRSCGLTIPCGSGRTEWVWEGNLLMGIHLVNGCFIGLFALMWCVSSTPSVAHSLSGWILAFA